ncbi:hypothetical protein A6V36_09745 [Paraburkholderia ginsengiterrae]|nr:hypothetical protein A6V36_09745 [Paraburkholderia ginsengiterrae]
MTAEQRLAPKKGAPLVDDDRGLKVARHEDGFFCKPFPSGKECFARQSIVHLFSQVAFWRGKSRMSI